LGDHSLPFKVCPECGVEHVHSALVCIDCNVALELAPAAGAEPAALAPLPPASELAQVATGGPWEMERLALALQEAGFSSRIDTTPPGQPLSQQGARSAPRGSAGGTSRLALYVLPAEAEPALALIQELLLQGGTGVDGQAREGDTLDACPACGAGISPVAEACSDCGLEFAPVEDA
jgi:hypothetical protein